MDDPSRLTRLPVTGFEVGGIEFYGGLLYVLGDRGTDRLRLQISGEFRLVAPDGTDALLNTEGAWSSLAIMLGLQYLPIQAIIIDHDPTLIMQAGAGWSIEVRQDDWELDGPSWTAFDGVR
jgi:hypothetical protein